MRGRSECRVQAGQRAGVTADDVGNNAVAEPRVDSGILIGVDQQFRHLRCETVDDPGHHRPAAQFTQALVDAAHATTEAAGEHDAGDRWLCGR